MTGILLSLKGGVMKPMCNLLLGSSLGIVGGGAAKEGVGGVEGSSSEPSRRVARLRMFTKSGRSVED